MSGLPESGHWGTSRECLLSAISGHRYPIAPRLDSLWPVPDLYNSRGCRRPRRARAPAARGELLDHDRARGVSRLFRPQCDVGVDEHPRHHLRHHHVGEGQPRHCRADWRVRDGDRRRVGPGGGV